MSDAQQRESKRRTGLRILLCEKDLLVALALAFDLRSRGHAVLVAHTHHEAVELTLRRIPDLAVVSDNFPNAHGRRSISDALSAVGRIPTLVLAENADLMTTRRAARAGARGVMGKSRPLSAVVHAIEQVSRGALLMELDAPAERQGRRTSALTPRERQVASLLAEGATTAVIASRMRISQGSARTYVQNVLEKLGAHSRLEAVSIVTSDGLHVSDLPAQRERRLVVRSE